MAGKTSKQETRRPPWFGPLAPLRDEFEDVMSKFFGDESEGWLGRGVGAALDLAETDQTVEIKLDLPGIKPADVDIQLSGNALTIRGQRKEETTEDDKEKAFHRVERRYGSFSRTVTLPCAVNEDEATAEFNDGVLTITLPKAEEAKARKIKIKR